MADAEATGDVEPSAEEVTQQSMDEVSPTVTQDSPMDVGMDDVPAAENLVAVLTTGEVSQSAEDLATQGLVQVMNDNVPEIFTEGDMEVSDGPEMMLAEQDVYIEGDRQQNIELSTGNLNVRVIEPMQESSDDEQAMDVGPQLLEVPNDDQQEQLQQQQQPLQQEQPEDVSPSSDSVEQFSSRQGDQELQVVPDSSTVAVSDRSRFVSENLHEAMDSLLNRQSPATLALGVQMVPTSSNDVAVSGLHELQTLGPEEQEQEHEQQMVSDELTHQVASAERQTVPVSEASGAVALNDQQQQQQPALYAFQQTEGTYEVCVSLPTADEQSQMQEMPVDLQGWTELSAGQSLVAVAEDGTTIPLTIVRQGTDVELSYSATDGDNLNDVQHILQQLTSSSLQQQPQQLNEGPSVILNVDQTLRLDVADGGSVTKSILPDENTATGSGEQLGDVIHIPEEAYEVTAASVADQAVDSTSARKPELPAIRKRHAVARKPPQPPLVKSQMATTKAITQEANGETGTVEMVVELSNTTPSAISPENMQTLIEILQSLPATARGQTIQIILQTEPTIRPADAAASGSADVANTSMTMTPFVHVADDTDITVMEVVKKFTPKRLRKKTATSDIAIQVSPEFIESEQNQKPAPAPRLVGHTLQLANNIMTEHKASPSRMDMANEMPESSDKVADKGSLSEDEKSRQIMAAIMDTSRKRRAFRKKNSKQIVTVEEQWVTDPKPGVSYYAVVDYLSEPDQDGFSSASEMKRPEAMSSAFMEDHLELQNGIVGSGGLIDDLAKKRSILESTIDSSTIVSPYRRQVSHKLKTAMTNSKTIDLPPIESLDDQSGVTLQEKSFDHVELNEGDINGGDKAADQQQQQPQPPAADETTVSDILRPKVRKKQLTKKQSTPRRAATAASSRSASKVRYEHKCGYCGYDSADKILVVEHCLASHPDMPIRTLSLLPQTIGRTCPYCRQHFEHTEFFAHMRFAHSEVHPYKCGYCDFMGRDRNQIRHHIQKKHRLPMKVINLLDPNRPSNHQHEDAGGGNDRQRQLPYGGSISDGEESVYEYRTDEEEMDDLDEDDAMAADPRRGLSCPECKKTFKTLKYLKTHIKVHQPHRYQCGYCSFYSVMLPQVLRHCQKMHSDVDPKVITKELEPDKNPIVSRDMDDVIKKVFSLNTRLPRDPDQTKWMRKWFCPHCDYTCQFGASYRRHLRMHANILAYKCNYCSFKGRERYYVRRHISRMHPELPGIVVENNPENCAHDTSSDEGFQEKGLRRKRHRRPKESLHAVVPVKDMDPDALREQYQQQPKREKKSGSGRWTSDADSDTATTADAHAADLRDVAPAKVVYNRAAKFPRVSLTSSPNDIKPATDDETIVCRACNQRVAAKSFQQHAKNHFKKIVPLKCAHCNFMSVNRSSIEKHSRDKHQNLPFRSEECHLASLAPRDFVALIGGNSGEAGAEDPEPPKFTCPLCQTMVDYDKNILSSHFYTHFEYFPFSCSLCDHQNVSRYKVRKHAEVVHGDRPFSVHATQQKKPDGLEETIQQFLREGQEIMQAKLTELMEQQQQESCSNLSAADNVSEVVSHVFVCPICQLQMDLKVARLRHHLHDHYSYKPFKCADCRYVSSRRSRIRRHATKEHAYEARIEPSDRIMPDDLSKMLREIDQELKAIRGHPGDENVDGESLGPKSDMAKTWMDQLSQGKCPWCKETESRAFGDDEDALRGHVMSHFGGKETAAHACAHCGKSYGEKLDAVQHVEQEHPGLEIRVTVDVSEDIVRRELAMLLAVTKTKPAAESNDKEAAVATADTAAPSKKDVYDFDDNDIVTVEGVLLTRTFRSVNEGLDDGSDGDASSSEETDSDDSDLLIGDVDPQLVSDVKEILKGPSFLQCNEEQQQPQLQLKESAAVMASAEESSFVQIFVCGYCDFYSEEQDITKAHTEENHLKSGLLESSAGQEQDQSIASTTTTTEPSPPLPPPLMQAKKHDICRGGATKGPAIKTRGAKRLSCQQYDQELRETMEKIIRLVEDDVDKEDEFTGGGCTSPPAEEETLENIIKMVQSMSNDSGS